MDEGHNGMTETPMHIVLGGVRGSRPVSHPDFMRFGGATTSVLIDNGAGARIVIDAGTGLQTLQPHLSVPDASLPVLLLFTHYHLDHLIGLPPFAPLYDPAHRFVFAAPPRHGTTVRQALDRLTAPPFWPVAFRAGQQFLDLPATCEAPYRHGPFDVRWCAVHHENGCHAYRIDDRATGASVVFATDLEWRLSDEAERKDFLRLCREPRPLDLLIMEGHYDSEAREGWGHSRWQDAAEVARQVCARHLVVTHLAPEADDLTLEAREHRLQALCPHARLGRQGLSILWQRGDAGNV
jgi:phosphoribosyl 1,2-cyclic phosphodiesterase